jgi:hypothetical protein
MSGQQRNTRLTYTHTHPTHYKTSLERLLVSSWWGNGCTSHPYHVPPHLQKWQSWELLPFVGPWGCSSAQLCDMHTLGSYTRFVTHAPQVVASRTLLISHPHPCSESSHAVSFVSSPTCRSGGPVWMETTAFTGIYPIVLRFHHTPTEHLSHQSSQSLSRPPLTLSGPQLQRFISWPYHVTCWLHIACGSVFHSPKCKLNNSSHLGWLLHWPREESKRLLEMPAVS